MSDGHFWEEERAEQCCSRHIQTGQEHLGVDIELLLLLLTERMSQFGGGQKGEQLLGEGGRRDCRWEIWRGERGVEGEHGH